MVFLRTVSHLLKARTGVLQRFAVAYLFVGLIVLLVPKLDRRQHHRHEEVLLLPFQLSGNLTRSLRKSIWLTPAKRLAWRLSPCAISCHSSRNGSLFLPFWLSGSASRFYWKSLAVVAAILAQVSAYCHLSSSSPSPTSFLLHIP